MKEDCIIHTADLLSSMVEQTWQLSFLTILSYTSLSSHPLPMLSSWHFLSLIWRPLSAHLHLCRRFPTAISFVTPPRFLCLSYLPGALPRSTSSVRRRQQPQFRRGGGVKLHVKQMQSCERITFYFNVTSQTKLRSCPNQVTSQQSRTIRNRN